MTSKKNTRVVRDHMGEISIDADALYGAQTARAVANFPVSGQPMPQPFIEALILIKEIAAKTNIELDRLETDTGQAIMSACQELSRYPDLMDQFPVDIYQTGSGTSSNMNANEVIATIASRILGRHVDAYDHVNCGQSSNDVIPTAIHVSTAMTIHQDLIPAFNHLTNTIREKSATVEGITKTGRTHLMDAMPVTMTQSLNGWADQLGNAQRSLESIRDSIHELALGGTAVGTGINTHPEFGERFALYLSNATAIPFRSADNYFPLIGSQDAAVAVSGQLKVLAVAIMKIANDLRWMNSGPVAGLSEISLEELQAGSSIMPGKVNPVIPESAAMVAAQVIGNDAAITIGGQSGNFELNVMLPLIGYNLLSSVRLLSSIARLLADKAIRSFTVNTDKLEEALHRNPILVTSLTPVIGYEKAADIARTAYSEERPIIEVALEKTDLTRVELASLLDPHKLTGGH